MEKDTLIEIAIYSPADEMVYSALYEPDEVFVDEPNSAEAEHILTTIFVDLRTKNIRPEGAKSNKLYLPILLGRSTILLRIITGIWHAADDFEELDSEILAELTVDGNEE